MKISGVLLAGGKSRRMGRDKSTVLFHGAPLWQNQVELLRRLQLREIFVSAQTGQPWRPADVVFVNDDQPSRGPLSGIAAALSRITTTHLLVLAIDMPFMTEDYLRRLCENVGAGRGVVPVNKDCFEPLAAIYPSAARVDFIDALSGNDFSLQSLARKLIAIGKLRPLQVSEHERALFRNLNEPRDL